MNDNLIALSEGLELLHECWQPLDWQVPLGRALFYDGIKDIGAQCGRSTGKTELAAYCNWRYAFEVPGSENYLIEPLFNQGREILWASNRLQSFGPQDWIQSINHTECRITFKNGSFIKIEGSDNVDKLRGLKPRGLITWDELKDIKPEAIAAMDPNRARYDAPCLYLGTPPEIENHYMEIMAGLKSNPRSYWTQAGSFENKHNSVSWLNNKKKQLVDGGRSDEWFREYEAQFVKGGKKSVFPQYFKYIPKPKTELLPSDINHWHLMLTFDPGSSSVFAVGFFLFNPYSKRIMLMDEIYETDMALMTTKQIYLRCVDILKAYPKVKDIRYVYDEAATWFRNEMSELCDWWLEPTMKATNSKEHGIGLIRDCFNQNLIEIADECVKAKWEFENYIKDANGKIPKVNDHLLDVIRYTLHAFGFNLNQEQVPIEVDPDTQRRGYSMEEDMAQGYDMREI